jgi:hypothetical protein
MISGLHTSCDATGFVPRHASACLDVADRFGCAILFREPGKAARRLIDEGYGMKGFRIDTKSCNWGPMSGFVCMDPRLSKPKSDGSSNAAFNAPYTEHALKGGDHSIGSSFVKPADKADLDAWKADVMPIVISRARIDELGLNGKRDKDGHLIGESTYAFRDAPVTLNWRLIPVGNAKNAWITSAPMPSGGDYHVLCLDKAVRAPFKQTYIAGAQPIMFRGHETVLGLTNPGTKDDRGFFACVTADYDLFAVLPPIPSLSGKPDAVAGMHNVMGSLLARKGLGLTPLAGGVPRLSGVDQRLRVTKTEPKSAFEHYKHGDVSGRIMMIKVALNSAIGVSGNAVHHNDEAGNEFLAKANLQECMPVICFLPNRLVRTLQDPADFKAFYETFVRDQLVYKGKRSWADAANVVLTERDRQSAF